MTAHKSAHRRLLAVAGAVAAGALVLAGCGDSGSESASKSQSGTQKGSGHSGHSGHGSDSSQQPKSGKSPAPGAFNDADVMFAQMMIPHHEQALEMSELAADRASDKEVRKMAADIEKAQGPEIKTMKSWLKSWGKPASAGHGGMDHSMAGMLSDGDMKELKAANGKEFDRRFTKLMVDHHKGALDMAKEERDKGRNATAKKLASEVAKSQSKEITHLQSLNNSL